MSIDAFAISLAAGHELSQRDVARESSPSLSTLVVLFAAAIVLAIGTAMFFPLIFAIVAGAGFALYCLGDHLALANVAHADWRFAAAFGVLSATILFIFFRLALALETGLANHSTYRIARHLWRSAATFAATFVLLSMLCRSADIRAPSIGAAFLTLAFQAILFRSRERDRHVRRPVLACAAGLLLLAGLVPASFALHFYATHVVVEAYGSPEQKRAQAHAIHCSLTGGFDICQDAEALYSNVNRWLLYHGPLPPPWVLHREFAGKPANPVAWSVFKAELRHFSARGLPIGTSPERARFIRELAEIVNKWGLSQDAFAFAASTSQRSWTLRPPDFLLWALTSLDRPVPAAGDPRDTASAPEN